MLIDNKQFGYRKVCYGGLGILCLLVATQVFADSRADGVMSAHLSCNSNAITQSRCIIEEILNDVGDTYRSVGGGGISSIKQDATRTYTVSISQEERVDQITYTVDISPEGKVTIINRQTGTKSDRR